MVTLHYAKYLKLPPNAPTLQTVVVTEFSLSNKTNKDDPQTFSQPDERFEFSKFTHLNKQNYRCNIQDKTKRDYITF